MTERIVLRGGDVVTAEGPARADVAIAGGTVTATGSVAAEPGDRVVDASGRLILPGFVDAHAHADGLVGDDAVARTLLRQGVTTVIAGQDGVSYAPGDGAYATEYFAAINGAAPGYRGDGVAGYLGTIDGTAALNVGYLVPAGTVRHLVCGRREGAASDEERAAMTHLVAQGMREGALGLSTGLDYVPGMFQDAAEIAALCAPVAEAGGVYVSHMRGGYEDNAAAGVAEMSEIVRRVRDATGHALRVHVSHFHADADIVLGLLDGLAADGVDATFDAYPYIRGCTLLGMPLLPPEVSALPVDAALARLREPSSRAQLRVACTERASHSPSLGPEWPDMITLAHVAAPEWAWALGLTLREASDQIRTATGTVTGTAPIDVAFDILTASRMEASAVMAVHNPRPRDQLARILAHPAHMGGSDGIHIGAHPHPRAAGTFARYLREYVRELHTWTWADAVHHLSAHPVARFGLGERGVVRSGAVADVIVVDPDEVADLATYADPTPTARGIDDVFVAGRAVLAGGELTGARPGRGIRRRQHPHRPPGPARTARGHFEKERHPMPKTGFHTDGAPTPAGPYSHGVIAHGFLYTSGFGPQDPAADQAVPDGVSAQTRQALRNVQTVLASQGLGMDDVVKTTVHLADLADFAEFNAAYGEFFTAPYPVRTTVGSQLSGILVEIDVVAAFPEA